MCEQEDPEEGKLEPRDIYGPIVELAIHSQDNKINLFTSFLFFQSIFLLAWSTVWQMEIAGRLWILSILAAFGAGNSVVWAMLAPDYADSARKFSQAAAGLERYFPKAIPHLISAREATIRGKPKWIGSKFLISFVTWGFVVLYFVLELVVLIWNHTSTTVPRGPEFHYVVELLCKIRAIDQHSKAS
jgi:hypothetical protein